MTKYDLTSLLILAALLVLLVDAFLQATVEHASQKVDSVYVQE